MAYGAAQGGPFSRTPSSRPPRVPQVAVVAVPERRTVCRLYLVEGPGGAGALQERKLRFQDLRLGDGRVVHGAWDGSELTLYVWAPHLNLYGVELLQTLARELSRGPRRSEAPAKPGLPERIILVEDDVLMARTVQRLLEQAGFEVVTTDSPFAFQPLLNEAQPQLVLVDVQLPAISGDMLIQMTQGAGGRHRCPMVLFSAAPEEELQRLADASGAAGYIRKTGTLQDLAQRARAFIEADRQR